MKLWEDKGIRLFIRDEQPATDDAHVVNEVIAEDCYRLEDDWFKGNTVIDIGTNLGATSLLIKHRYPQETVISFEPEPHNFQMLTMNNALNNYVLDIRQQAVGIPGWTYMDNGSGHSQTGKTHGSKVKVVSLNDVVKEIETVDVLKIDCEGGEYDIFETATDETFKKIKVIIGEFHSWRWIDDPKRHERMIKRLEKFYEMSYYGYLNSNFQARLK